MMPLKLVKKWSVKGLMIGKLELILVKLRELIHQLQVCITAKEQKDMTLMIEEIDTVDETMIINEETIDIDAIVEAQEEAEVQAEVDIILEDRGVHVDRGVQDILEDREVLIEGVDHLMGGEDIVLRRGGIGKKFCFAFLYFFEKPDSQRNFCFNETLRTRIIIFSKS